jgi:hypothetical protein
MSKKLFFVGALVMLSASLFLLGCPTDSDDNSSPAARPDDPWNEGDHTGLVAGSERTGEWLQKYIDDALAETPPRTLTFDDLTITEGQVDLKGADVTIRGTLTLKKNVVVKAMSGAKITFDDKDINGNDAIAKIVDEGYDAARPNSATCFFIGSSSEFSERIVPPEIIADPNPGPDQISHVFIARENLPGDAPTVTNNTLVYGTLTVNDTTSINGGVKVVAIGPVVINEKNDDVLTVTAGSGKIDLSRATSIDVAIDGTTATTVTVELPDTGLKIPEISISSGDTLTITGPAGNDIDDIKTAVTGEGTLIIDNAASAKAVLTATGDVKFDNGNKIVFDDESSITAKTITFKAGFGVAALPTTSKVTLGGEVLLGSTPNLTFGDKANKLTLKEDSTITVSGGTPSVAVLKAGSDGLTITGDSSGSGAPQFTLTNAGALTIGTGATIFTGSVEFGGTFTSTGVAVDFKKTSESAPSEVTFKGAVSGGTSLTFAGDAAFESTVGATILTIDGDAEFGGALTATGAVTIGGDAVFKTALGTTTAFEIGGAAEFFDSLTLGAAATFNGQATFAQGKLITLSAGGSIITLGKAGGALAVKPNATDAAVAPILVADTSALPTDSDPTLTPAAGTTLTFTADGIEQGPSASVAHKVTIAGKVKLGTNAIYTVDKGFGSASELTIATGSVLTLGDTGKLVLTGDAALGATLKGSGTSPNEGKVVAGATEIIGGTNGWNVVVGGGDGTAITISKNKIEADDTLVTLKAMTGGTVDPKIVVKAGGNLTLGANVEIDLAGTIASLTNTSVGSIELHEGTTGAKITFTDTTSIITIDSNDTDAAKLSATIGDFANTPEAGKITVSNFDHVAVHPGNNEGSYATSIKGTATSGYLQAYSGSSANDTVTINAGCRTTN